MHQTCKNTSFKSDRHGWKTLLHTDAFTHRGFYTQTLLHTDTFTHRHFYPQKLLHTHTRTHTHSHSTQYTKTDAIEGLLQFVVNHCLITLASISCQVPSIKTIPFYKADGRQCNIVRHEKNSRRQETVLATYVASVKSKGIIKGVRGEAWMLAPASEDGAYQALTFGTLTEAFYRAMDQIGDDKHSYPDLCHTASAGLDAVVLDHRTPDSILEFL